MQAIAIAFQWRQSWPMLVVCPSSLRGVWLEQLARWTPNVTAQAIYSGATPVDPSTDVVVVSYALLAKCPALQRFNGQGYKIVIADECVDAQGRKVQTVLLGVHVRRISRTEAQKRKSQDALSAQ